MVRDRDLSSRRTIARIFSATDGSGQVREAHSRYGSCTGSGVSISDRTSCLFLSLSATIAEFMFYRPRAEISLALEGGEVLLWSLVLRTGPRAGVRSLRN